MKLIKSPLQMINFWILHVEIKTIRAETTVKANELFSDYDVDIDFAIKDIGEHRLAFVKCNINRVNPAGGYSIFVEGVTRYKVLDESVRAQTDPGCLSISIQNLRNYLETATYNGQFGKYVLPTVNLGEMIVAKNQQTSLTSIQKKKPRVIKKKKNKLSK